MLSISSSYQQNILMESIPWRNGIVQFAIGETILDNTPMDCFIINNIEWLFKLNPSFMLCLPKDPRINEPFASINRKGSETNGIIIVSSEAQHLGYSKIDSGLCKAKTYFFGRKKPERTFDLFFRLVERGFSISDIEGIKLFDGTEIFDITTNKKDYSKSSFITGKRVVATPILGRNGKIVISSEGAQQIPCRIRHK